MDVVNRAAQLHLPQEKEIIFPIPKSNQYIETLALFPNGPV